MTCFSFFFFIWLVVQFAKLNLMRNLFTPSGFPFTAVYSAYTLSYFHFRDFYQLETNQQNDREESEKSERKRERATTTIHCITKTCKQYNNTNRIKNVRSITIMHTSSTKAFKKNRMPRNNLLHEFVCMC